MDREKQIEEMAAVIRRPHYSGNETKVLPSPKRMQPPW